MGKKEKKDSKPAPDDIFDTLNIESHQAHTAVLLLESVEEDVLGRSCEAIYKFADKCDDNKKALLDQGVVPHLLSLSLHEDRVVKKNATAAFGVLAQCPEVRRQMRKLDDTIPNMIELLSPNEETVVQEFAALCLSQMALEYTSKAMILESGGMECLVKGLASTDPDVQKNCLEAVALLLMDFKGRASLREFEGLSPVVVLIASEFAIIQQLAILTLDRAAQEAECRTTLRELETVGKLVDVVGHSDWSDLHVQSVQVLSHLLEDTITLEQIKETGGIKRLVALITDQTPPEEDTKKDKKAGSKTGKKSAKGDAKKKEEEKEEKEEGIIPTLPDVKICACQAIARSARNGDNRRLLHDMEAEKMLIHLLSHENVEVQAAAAFGLAVMAEYTVARDSIREWEGIPPLVKMLHVDNATAKEACTCALANLTSANQTNCLELESGTAIDHLVNLLGDPYMGPVANTCTVLMNLASDEGLRSIIQSKGAVSGLLAPLNTGHVDVQSKATLAVAALVCDADSRSEMCTSGALEALIPLLQSGNDELRRNACWAVTVCAVDETTANELCRLGAMEILQEIQASSTRKNKFAEAALNKLLDSNLSAKYALTGVLNSSNIIGDEFFDCGRIRPDKEFLTLEERLQEELTDQRAIITVNAKLASSTSASTVMDADIKPDGSKINISGKSSRTGRESKTKTKAQREREEKAREEEIASQQRDLDDELKSIKACPPDTMLVNYIEDVQEKIEPMVTSREQAVALAKYVSDRMGGPIEYEKVAQFSWELPISQIMFDTKSNIVPIGKIRHGIHIHRAVLFKTLADKIALPCSLVRGEYNRAWNEILLSQETQTTTEETAPEFPASLYIVDLVHDPGRLLLADSPPAINYTKI